MSLLLSSQVSGVAHGDGAGADAANHSPILAPIPTPPSSPFSSTSPSSPSIQTYADDAVALCVSLESKPWRGGGAFVGRHSGGEEGKHQWQYRANWPSIEESARRREKSVGIQIPIIPKVNKFLQQSGGKVNPFESMNLIGCSSETFQLN